MNCQNHPEVPATAYCRSCGKAVCDECRRDAFGTVFCAEHAPAPAAAPPPPAPGPAFTPPPTGRRAPAGRCAGIRVRRCLAGPRAVPRHDPRRGRDLQRPVRQGPGARGDVRDPVSIADSRARPRHGVVFGMMAFAWWAYMVFEAYHTARKRRYGEPVDEYSSMLNLRGGNDQVPFAGDRADRARHTVAAAHARTCWISITWRGTGRCC